MPTVPHLAWPIRLTTGNTFAAVDQDTQDEHRQAVALVLSTPVGSLVDNPKFGTPEQALRAGGASAAEIETAVEKWEPRTVHTTDPHEVLHAIQAVDVAVSPVG